MKPQLLIGSPVSGSGKTTFALGFLRAMKRKGLSVQPFKCGADYVDSFYHGIACGKDSVNLDIWMASKSHVQYLYNTYAEQADVCLLDGSMGLFDGYSKMKGSSAEIAQLLHVPVVMIVNARTTGYSAAPMLYGFQKFRPQFRIVGVVFNQITSSSHYSTLREACIDAGVECLGYIPAIESLRLPNRHSAFTTEIREHINKVIDLTADLIEQYVDVKKMLDLCTCTFPCLYQLPYHSPDGEVDSLFKPFRRKLNIAVARDSAFCFLYKENIDKLSELGRISYFSPVYGSNLPQTDFVYLPGGYPELFARQLHRRKRLLQQLKDYAENGGLILAEGAGVSLLSQTLVLKQGGIVYDMAGILPLNFTASQKSMIGYKKIMYGGTEYRGYEYRYVVSDDEFPLHQYKNVIAISPHLYFGGTDLSRFFHFR